jgi:hypothetical protein
MIAKRAKSTFTQHAKFLTIMMIAIFLVRGLSLILADFRSGNSREALDQKPNEAGSVHVVRFKAWPPTDSEVNQLIRPILIQEYRLAEPIEPFAALGADGRLSVVRKSGQEGVFVVTYTTRNDEKIFVVKMSRRNDGSASVVILQAAK